MQQLQEKDKKTVICPWRLPPVWKRRVHYLSALHGQNPGAFITSLLEERYKDFDFDLKEKLEQK